MATIYSCLLRIIVNVIDCQVMREKRQSGEIDLATPNNSGQFKMEFQNLQEVHMSSLVSSSSIVFTNYNCLFYFPPQSAIWGFSHAMGGHSINPRVKNAPGTGIQTHDLWLSWLLDNCLMVIC